MFSILNVTTMEFQTLRLLVGVRWNAGRRKDAVRKDFLPQRPRGTPCKVIREIKPGDTIWDKPELWD